MTGSARDQILARIRAAVRADRANGGTGDQAGPDADADRAADVDAAYAADVDAAYAALPP